MKKIVSLFLFLIVLLSGLIVNSASGLASNGGEPVEETAVKAKSKFIDWNTEVQKISAIASDSLELFGWLKPANVMRESPLVVMLPMMNHTHDSYDPFIKSYKNYGGRLQAAKPYFLSLDLRGHGESVSIGDKKISHKDMKEADFAKMPGDVVTMIKAVLARPDLNINRGEIYIIGASIGANCAALIPGQFDQIAKVVLLSPGEDYRGLKPAQAMTEFNGKTIILAEVDDLYSARSSDKLAKLNNRCMLKLFEGHDHGTNLINNDSTAMNMLIEWLLR